MKRALVAAVLTSASLVALPALAQPYQERGDDRGYSQQQPPPQGQYDRGDDRRGDDQDRGSQGYVRRELETTPTYPDRANGDRRYQRDPRSIDPAPGATRPYVGVGPQRFYNVEERMDQVEQRLASLPAAQRKRAYSQMRSIRAEERTQRAKHGGQLRDWDREHLNKRLDALVHGFPGLGR